MSKSTQFSSVFLAMLLVLVGCSGAASDASKADTKPSADKSKVENWDQLQWEAGSWS